MDLKRMKGKNTESEATSLINNFEVVIFCEHCETATTHEELGQNGTCPKCKKEIKELF